ncbi:alpha/beta hydrolase [Leisingera daeponensis]|uniref:Alpha/beta hydrolase n=1 Tax=Leisingera daeponensis TaxID=405746 RepID=A0ABS7NCM3_9RHOB|nr:alpha/beta hydrolase [Leisingera daeponensis]MBY6138959.1 alpha/beta hydrolase [Leisingera daeponensis]
MENYHIVQGCIHRDGYTLGYSIEGEGEPLLIIGSHVFYPRTFSAGLRSKRKLIFIDHRGFAQAGRRAEARDCSLETITGDISAMCSALGLSRLDVLGHSGHGYMALEFARRRPDLVRKTVVVATGPSHSPEHMAYGERIWNMLAAPDRKHRLAHDLARMAAKIEAEPQKRFIWMCLGLAARSWFDPCFDASELWQGVHVNMPVFDSLWGEVFRDFDPVAALQEIQAPLLICMGRHDHLVAPLETWLPLIPANRQPAFALFERSGHAPQLEEAELFDETLLNFLA